MAKIRRAVKGAILPDLPEKDKRKYYYFIIALP